ncbi:MAG TPA: DNA-processing protein DprA [Candidatus Saccharimonas sp.]|nr:DNA-processing protein DprA [Candidatus Saccharimonas sp.]
MKINNISPLKHKYLQITSVIAKPPQMLHYIGMLPDTRVPTIAIVGTRKPTSYGREVTERLAYDLAKRGIVVVSGLALGVDAIAHAAALDAGGTTLAVLPCGLPKIAPATNHQLAHRIVAGGGALISEYTADAPVAWKSHMLERNRLVAGLADAILITEASARSGTLNTAGHALEQGKHVFVVPGNITSPQSAGCNLLIKQGATPVTCAEDILEVIAPQLLTTQSQFALGSNPTETAILEQLRAGLRNGEEIQRTLGIDSGEFNIALTMLELAGAVKALGANQWTLR